MVFIAPVPSLLEARYLVKPRLGRLLLLRAGLLGSQSFFNRLGRTDQALRRAGLAPNFQASSWIFHQVVGLAKGVDVQKEGSCSSKVSSNQQEGDIHLYHKKDLLVDIHTKVVAICNNCPVVDILSEGNLVGNLDTLLEEDSSSEGSP